MRSESVIALRSFLLAALGAAPFGCGGSVASDVPPNADAGAGGITDAAVTDATKAEGGTLIDGSIVPPAGSCEGAKPILIGGKDTGLDECAGGRVVRRAATTCPSLLPRAGGGICPLPDAGIAGGCGRDSDCTEKPNGYCSTNGGFSPGCSCAYGCAKDGDCAAGQICRCGDPIGQCLQATCTDATSCKGGQCAEYDSSRGCLSMSFACTTPADTCSSAADCSGPNAYCDPNGTTGAWECQQGGCAIGRPFVVEGQARVAPVARRTDWALSSSAPLVDAVDASTRDRLAAHWSEVAQLEHASIASFARFALELLALGAGPDLVLGAQAAMSDEIRHARIAFGFASAYGDTPVGPGALLIEGSLEPFSLPAFVERLVREGCVGETLGALEAAEAAARSTDPKLRDVLKTIAEDESAHAALAWRTLRFVVARGGEEIAKLADATIDRALADMAASLDAATPVEGLETHGVLSTSTRKKLHAEAVVGILSPCRDAAHGPHALVN